MRSPHPSRNVENLPTDHLDLILTAAIQMDVISAPTGTPRPRSACVAFAQRIGTHLYLRNRNRDRSGYLYRPVEGPIDLLEVIKACHAAQHAYRTTPLWSGSVEQIAVDAVAKAATMRLPGYADTRWIWRRPAEPVIGFAPSGSWHPDVDGVPWLDDVDELATRWEGAGIVLLTHPALAGLPKLTARSRVYLVAEPDDAAAAITDADHAQVVESVLVWPEAEEWLRAQLHR